jgi:Leucine-rich repeat (LRR) protein
MYYLGTYVYDTQKNTVDTTIIKGKFSYRIRDAHFDWKIKTQEENIVAFKKLINQNPDTITSVNLSNCNLTSLPEELFLFKNVQVLNISENDFSTANLSGLCKLKKLKGINLDKCNLTKVPDGVLCLQNLESFEVFANDISTLPDRFYQLKNLKYLQLEYNRITELSPRITDLHNLEFLDLAGNKINKLPMNIEQLRKLNEFLPPDSLQYLPVSFAKFLSPYSDHSDIGNYKEFEHLIPKD